MRVLHTPPPNQKDLEVQGLLNKNNETFFPRIVSEICGTYEFLLGTGILFFYILVVY